MRPLDQRLPTLRTLHGSAARLFLLADFFQQLGILLARPLIFPGLLALMDFLAEAILFVSHACALRALLHVLDEFTAPRFLDRLLELASEVDPHLLRALLRPQPNVARVPIERLVAWLGSIEIRQPRILIHRHRERRHHAMGARRTAMSACGPGFFFRTQHHLRARTPAAATFVLEDGHLEKQYMNVCSATKGYSRRSLKIGKR